MTDSQIDAMLFAVLDKAREQCPIDWLSIKGDFNADKLAALREVARSHMAASQPEASR